MSSETKPRDPHGEQRPQRDLFGVKLLGAITILLIAAMAGSWIVAKKPWQASTAEKRNAFSIISNEPRLTPRTNELFLPSQGQSSLLAPRIAVDTSGFSLISSGEIQWNANASLPEIAKAWTGWTDRTIAKVEERLANSNLDWKRKLGLTFTKAGLHMSAGEPRKASEVLSQAREDVEHAGPEARRFALSTIIYFQGIAALRLGENENCVLCRGESSCILPISPAAVHQNPEGSREAIKYFKEYLSHFPDDLEVRWLLNIAHMTLGEHPEKVYPDYLISLDRYRGSKADIGKFRDIGERAGVNRFNQAGGVIMDDFDNDGLYDLAVTTFDPTGALDIYKNMGDGAFKVITQNSPSLSQQYGGLVCVQADYDNDGLMDIFIPRGAWLSTGIRPSLLHNEGEMRFKDVTAAAGMLSPVNSNASAWADFDNDGLVDLFVCAEKQAHRLYRNKGDGTFEDVAKRAGLTGDIGAFAKACTWIDYDRDDYPDLFINYLNDKAQLFHNERNGKFFNVTQDMQIDGPRRGFTCWAWDYDNDGWQDIFATCYDQTLEDVVKGLLGRPHMRDSNRLFRNREGKGFENVTDETGLDLVFATMGANCGDFDNDGFLDFYLGTGAPDLGLLIPNRMFVNQEGNQFVEVTGTAGVGHLQKGHAVAPGDWDRDGNTDIFIQMGGAVDGDRFRNILFQNPGHDNNWLSVKLVGVKSNRSAIGARIKVVTAGEKPLTVYRHVSPGGSFGSGPLEQTIGLGKAASVATVEIYWPTSHETQVFHDITTNQAVEIVEGSADYKVLKRNRVPQPPELEPMAKN